MTKTKKVWKRAVWIGVCLILLAGPAAVVVQELFLQDEVVGVYTLDVDHPKRTDH